MIIATKKKKKETSKEEDKNNTWVKATEDTKKIKEVWSDGYDFGDVTKTILGVSKIAKDTTKDALVNIGKGFMSTVEGSVDSIRYGMSDIYRKLAEKNPDQTIMTGGIVLGKPQQISDKLKENAQYEVTKNLLGEENDIFKENWSAKVDEKSVLGNKSDSIFQGVGNVGAFVGMSQLTGGSNLSTFLNSFSSAYGNARTEAYKQGADDKTANRAGWISGLAEGISEQFFSGIPGMKTAGWGDALNSRLSQAIQKYLGSTAGKVALTFFDGLGEGSEEVISNMLNATFTDIMHYLDENYTYGMDDMSGNIPEDVFNSAFSQDSLDSFISAMFTSLLTGGGKQIIQNQSNARTSNKVAKQSDMSKSQANEIMEKIAERRANLTLEEDANYKERTEAIENARQQLNKEIRQEIKQGNTVDLNELFNQTPADNTQAQFTFNNDEIKNVRTDKQNVLANDMAKLNNVKSNHDLYRTINAIQSANNTQQYHITTTEGLYKMGIVDKTADGKYVMKDGSPYVPRGLNYKDGDIYINADVGSQSGTQAVYHEMFESFKKASPNEYKQFKQMVKDIVGEESIQESIQEYTKMYGEELTDNIEDEIINDKFGELAESQDFINRISNNRTLLQKFIDTVKNMINYVKGTEEERKLIKLQKELEKQFAKRYKATDFSQNKGETAYSLKDQQNEIIQKSNPRDTSLGEHTWINSADDIKTFEEALQADEYESGNLTPDFTNKMVEDALKTGKMTVYSSYPIKNGTFVTPSKMEAQSYAGNQNVYSKEVNLNDIAWIDSLQGQYAKVETDTKYSLSKDNNGRELSEGQKEYFKNSKVVDDNGNLVTVYHTTTDYTKQFNEFNPVGTEEYKYGDVAVNFYTDSKDMSSSYGHNVISPYTQQINSMEDVNRQLGERYRVEEKNGKYELYDNNDVIQLNNYEDLIKLFTKEEQDILNKTFNKSRSEVIEMLNNDEQFDLYDKTRQKFLNMLYLMNEGKGVKQSGTNRTIDELVDNYLNNKTIQPLKTFNNQEDLFRNITEAISPVEHYQYSGYLNIKNPYIVDGENKNWNNITRGISAENEKIYNSLTQKEKNYLSDLADKMDNMYSDYQDSVEGFYQRLNANNEKLYNKIAYNSSIRQKLFDTALYGWNDTYVNDLIGERETTNDIVKEVIDLNNNGYDYDGVIIKNIKDYGANSDNFDMNQANDVYITFGSNQFKAVDNLNPTEDADIRYSMTSNENIEAKDAPITQQEIAPIRQDLSKITEQMNNLSNQIETMQESLENASKGYVETYNEQRNENIPTRNLTEEDANTLQDALMQDEGYLRSLNEEANLNTENTQLVDKLVRNIRDRLDLDRGQQAKVRDIINNAIENEYSADEISQALQREFSDLSYDMEYQEAKEAKELIKSMPIDVSDSIKADIADYNDFRRRNFNKIIFSRSGGAVDSVYAELNNKMPYFFPDDIVNPSDQLQKIAEVANMSSIITESLNLDIDDFDDMADYIKNTMLEDEYSAQMQSQYDLEKNIQFDMGEDIVPTTIRTQDSIENYIENRDIAPVKPDKTQQRQERAEQRSRAYRIYREMITNRNAVIDDYARASGNKEIKFYGDKYNNSQSEANFNISNKQTDINGNWIGKGLDEIFEPIEKAGLGRAFDDYLFNKSNIERHNVGKGSVVPVEVSRQLVAQYERENPSFKSTAEEVYKFIDNYSKEQVDSGILAKEKYDDFRGEFGIYGDYVPFRIENLDKSRYYDDSGEAKAVSTFKRSKGGASDLSGLMGMKDAIANQVRASKGAIAFNELAKEIVQTNGKNNEIFDVDTRTDITNTNDALYKTEDGDYILSAYVNGEKVSTKISEELYNELSRANEDRIKQLEKDFSMVTSPLQKLSGFRRNILTTWNPTFIARNAIKDIQDAVINSKHTKEMLKNYIPGFKELYNAKTQEAQQFLALYGSDNLYGDYSKKGNWFTKANELIELAPRFAEFKASLQAGDSLQEALYNAREVTTNFGRGGYITKALNRNGFTFLNANVQGLSKLVRNLSGENGVKGVTSVVVKGAMFAVLPSILNHLLYGLGDDKDEEYEALSDYIKDNYYLIKTEGGNFVRIPKGRINAVFGSLARRMIEAGEGEGFDAKEWGENAWSQIGVGDSSGIQTIFTPLQQAQLFKNDKEHPGKAWYGGDIVPTRLQNKPASEQTDAKIDALSNFIGEKTGLSPYKINYVIDQYTGGIGDVLLPYITPETKNGAESFGEYLTAPIKDAFVVNSIDDNKYAGDFYDLKDKLEIQNNSEKATTEDKIKYKYMQQISKDMGELYKERREVQADTTLGKKAKYEKVQSIQNDINNLAKEALSNYQNVSSSDNYANIGDNEYYKNAKGEWAKISEDEQEFTAGMTNAEKDLYYNTKNKISGISDVYSAKLKQLSKNDPKKSQIYADKKEDITRAIVNSGLDNQTKAMVYSKYYSNKETMTNVVNAGYNVDTYITALNDIEQLRTKYSQKNGYTTEQRKAKTIAYINSLNMEIPQKAMMIRQYYKSFRDYNNDIVNFVGNLNIPYEDKKAILEGTGMTINGNNVSWK